MTVKIFANVHQLMFLVLKLVWIRIEYSLVQPRSQGLRGETVTKTLVKFILSFQNFGKKIACAVRHNRVAITVEYGCVALRMRFFPQNFGTTKRILPGSSSPSHREGPGTEVESSLDRVESQAAQTRARL